jgi:hypothetical protein
VLVAVVIVMVTDDYSDFDYVVIYDDDDELVMEENVVDVD